jgi:hypothetical protein
MKSITAKISDEASGDLRPDETIDVAVAAMSPTYLAVGAGAVAVAVAVGLGTLSTVGISVLIVTAVMYGIPALRRTFGDSEPQLDSTKLPVAPLFLAVTVDGTLLVWRQGIFGRLGPLVARLPQGTVTDATVKKFLGIFVSLSIEFSDGTRYKCQVPANNEYEAFGVSVLANS